MSPQKSKASPLFLIACRRIKRSLRFPRGKGLPIGNLTSQFFANVYLNELDQFVKHCLKARYYVRYVDDFIILSRDRAQLDLFRQKIDRFLQERLNLKLHPKKYKIAEVKAGIDFVGYFIRPDYVLVRRRVVGDFLFRLAKDLHEPSGNWAQIKASYFAHFIWANARGLTRKYG